MTVHQLGQHNRPATIPEIQAAGHTLLEAYADNPEVVGAIGLLLGLLDTVQCTCRPAAPTRDATVLHLPTTD